MTKNKKMKIVLMIFISLFIFIKNCNAQWKIIASIDGDFTISNGDVRLVSFDVNPYASKVYRIFRPGTYKCSEENFDSVGEKQWYSGIVCKVWQGNEKWVRIGDHGTRFRTVGGQIVRFNSGLNIGSGRVYKTTRSGPEFTDCADKSYSWLGGGDNGFNTAWVGSPYCEIFVDPPNWLPIAIPGELYTLENANYIASGGGSNWKFEYKEAGDHLCSPPVENGRCEVLAYGPNQMKGWAEGETGIVAYTETIKYGSGERWVQKEITGTFICNNTTFAIDPAPGIQKFCYLINKNATNNFLEIR